jgi:hypothetical protein
VISLVWLILGFRNLSHILEQSVLVSIITSSCMGIVTIIISLTVLPDVNLVVDIIGV